MLLCLFLAGLNPNMNVNCMDLGGLSMKDPPQPQSRLSQWTHPNSMENLSGNSSPMEANYNKHGTNWGVMLRLRQLGLRVLPTSILEVNVSNCKRSRLSDL